MVPDGKARYSLRRYRCQDYISSTFLRVLIRRQNRAGSSLSKAIPGVRVAPIEEPPASKVDHR